MDNTGRLICVLGMHRSGTSCLIGSLQQAGLFLGDCHTWNPYNKKGNRENQKFVDLNDAVLAANGGAWNKPPKKPVWLPEQLRKAEALLEENSGEAPLGFKDPRTLLVVDGWMQVFPKIEFIGVVRHPNAVAQSLQNRSDMPPSQALSLWYAYNRVLLSEYQKKAFPILCFDEDERVFHQKLDQVVSEFGLNSGSAGKRFYDEKLRTSNSSEQQLAKVLPWKVKHLYKRLLKRCL